MDKKIPQKTHMPDLDQTTFVVDKQTFEQLQSMTLPITTELRNLMQTKAPWE